MATFIDGTLILQVINFMIAYWILATFFLRPAYAHLMRIKHERGRLAQETKSLERATQQLKVHAVGELQAAQRELVEYPDASRALGTQAPELELALEQPEQTTVSLEPADRRALVQAIVQRLKSKIVSGDQ